MSYCADNTKEILNIRSLIAKNRGKKVVAVQGLGFVGSAMLTAIASAKDGDGSTLYTVIGVDLPDVSANWKIANVNKGLLPIKSADKNLTRVFRQCFREGNVMATSSEYSYKVADVVIINIGLDVKKYGSSDKDKFSVALDEFVDSVRNIARYIKPSCLVIVESTVPPGTCDNILLPVFESEFVKRGLDPRAINMAYSYERVMPGKDYLKSIVSYYRVFSGINGDSKRKARAFLNSIINTRDYPLTELDNMVDAELGKVLENSYRALNIAFIQEWTEFAETAKINLFKVIEGVRKRQTHKNMMLPGFGVGGYCLTKDSLLADWSRRKIFGSAKRMKMSMDAVSINEKMPLHSFNLLKANLGKLKNRRLLIMGVSYRKDVADTRSSPTAVFYKKSLREGANVSLYDPMVDYWSEFDIPVLNDLSRIGRKKADVVVFAVDHDRCLKMSPNTIAGFLRPRGMILDCNNVISDAKADVLRKMGFKLVGVGKGHWNKV